MTRAVGALLVLLLAMGASVAGRPITSRAAGVGDGTGWSADRVVTVTNSARLRAALADARAGDRIVVADGRYTISAMTGKNGTAAKPVTITAAHRGRAVIDGGQLEVADSSHVTVEGLRWTNRSSLLITGSNHVRLTRNHFRDTGPRAVNEMEAVRVGRSMDNTSNIEIGANYTFPPVDSTIADNVVAGTRGKLFDERKAPVNLTYAGNIEWATGTATVGVTKPTEAIRAVDPLLRREGPVHRIGAGSPAIETGTGRGTFVTDDVDGQPRTGVPDVGADERSSAPVVRGPLRATDVGPDAR